MGKREVYDCDMCKKEAVLCHHFAVPVNSSFNGVDRDEVHQTFDLCFSCCGKVLASQFLGSYEANRTALKRLGLEIGVFN